MPYGSSAFSARFPVSVLAIPEQILVNFGCFSLRFVVFYWFVVCFSIQFIFIFILIVLLGSYLGLDIGLTPLGSLTFLVYCLGLGHFVGFILHLF